MVIVSRNYLSDHPDMFQTGNYRVVLREVGMFTDAFL